MYSDPLKKKNQRKKHFINSHCSVPYNSQYDTDENSSANLKITFSIRFNSEKLITMYPSLVHFQFKLHGLREPLLTIQTFISGFSVSKQQLINASCSPCFLKNDVSIWNNDGCTPSPPLSVQCLPWLVYLQHHINCRFNHPPGYSPIYL